MSNFDQYIDKERLQDLLADTTGKGVKVGIIDTGVESTHKHLGTSMKGIYDVVHQGRGKFKTEKVDEGEDFVGHGTACAGIIHDIAPDAELYSVRVIGSGLGDTTDRLLEGFRFALDQDWPILNLSLGTNKFNRPLFQLAEDACYKGKIIIASKDNQRNKVGYPAALSAVLAVDMEHFENAMEFRYRLGQKVEVEAKGIYVNAPSPGGGYQLYTGTSFACPHVSAITARLMEKIDGLTSFQLRTILAALGDTNEKK